jgi:hypothetical protein
MAPLYTEIIHEIASDMPANEIVDKYMLEFYYIDTPELRQQVAGQIDKLRDYGGPIYGRPSN